MHTRHSPLQRILLYIYVCTHACASAPRGCIHPQYKHGHYHAQNNRNIIFTHELHLHSRTHSHTTWSQVKKVGLSKVAQALKAGVGQPLSQLKDGLKQLNTANAAHDGQRQALVAKAFSDACDSAAEILSEPKYAVS